MPHSKVLLQKKVEHTGHNQAMPMGKIKAWWLNCWSNLGPVISHRCLQQTADLPKTAVPARNVLKPPRQEHKETFKVVQGCSRHNNMHNMVLAYVGMCWQTTNLPGKVASKDDQDRQGLPIACLKTHDFPAMPWNGCLGRNHNPHHIPNSIRLLWPIEATGSK